MSTTAVLTSGGIDSTACVAFYTENVSEVHGIYVDYGQPANHHEEVAAEAIADFYRIPLHVVRCAGLRDDIPGLTRGRNLLLLTTGLMAFPEASGVIALGIHSGTSYADCGADFVSHGQDLFDLYTQGAIQIGAPFVEWTKADIWAFCKLKDVPLHLTYSCELGLPQPCGRCRSCKDLESLRAGQNK